LDKTTNYIYHYINQSGQEYSSKVWKNNTIINFLNNNRQLESEFPFYSNAPEAVYILTSIETKWSPPKRLYNSPKLLNTNLNYKNTWGLKNKACLVWFTNIDRNFLFNINELKKTTNMVRILQLDDGEIYTVENK